MTSPVKSTMTLGNGLGIVHGLLLVVAELPLVFTDQVGQGLTLAGWLRAVTRLAWRLATGSGVAWWRIVSIRPTLYHEWDRSTPTETTAVLIEDMV